MSIQGGGIDGERTLLLTSFSTSFALPTSALVAPSSMMVKPSLTPLSLSVAASSCNEMPLAGFGSSF